MVEIAASNSLFFTGMAGSQLPIAVAHGEGRAEFASAADEAASRAQLALRFVDNRGQVATRYPANPNGSPQGAAGYASLGWTGHDPDAAPGARIPHGAEFLAPGGGRRGQRLDADVPERPGLGRLGDRATGVRRAAA